MKDLSNENIIHVKKKGIEYIQFKKLLEYSDIIKHAYGIGIDKNYRTSDHSTNNYKELCDALEIEYTNCVKPCQKHTANVKNVTKKININQPDFEQEEYKETDGLITNKSNIVLSTTNADCILIMFFDPIKKVIANIHSGWRGTLQRISVETVNKMKNEYKCNPSDIICCICPSIRKCHFEVSADVKELFYNEFKELNTIDKIITKVQNKEKWMIDTVEINKIILKQVGLMEKNIIDCRICSVCNSDQIHSYRVEGQGYGLGTAIIQLI